MFIEHHICLQKATEGLVSYRSYGLVTAIKQECLYLYLVTTPPVTQTYCPSLKKSKTISSLQYFETLNMYYNHTYKNDLNCTISSEIVLDLT